MVLVILHEKIIRIKERTEGLEKRPLETAFCCQNARIHISVGYRLKMNHQNYIFSNSQTSPNLKVAIAVEVAVKST